MVARLWWKEEKKRAIPRYTNTALGSICKLTESKLGGRKGQGQGQAATYSCTACLPSVLS